MGLIRHSKIFIASIFFIILITGPNIFGLASRVCLLSWCRKHWELEVLYFYSVTTCTDGMKGLRTFPLSHITLLHLCKAAVVERLDNLIKWITPCLGDKVMIFNH